VYLLYFSSCDKCPRITKTIEALNKHKMRHIPKSERKFICSTCDKIFITKDALKSHERSHIPIEERKIYHCDVCDLKWVYKYYISNFSNISLIPSKNFITVWLKYKTHNALNNRHVTWQHGEVFYFYGKAWWGFLFLWLSFRWITRNEHRVLFK
jgi:RNase P subunit RPR2